METLNVQKAHQEVTETAERNASPEVRKIDGMKIGEAVRQGDIYLHMVKDDHARGAATKNRQLAIGDTQGSRHILAGEAEVFEGTKAPEWAPNALLGPLFRLFKRATVTHPEHAHVDLEPGCYQVTHQMDARTLERVKD